MCQHKDQKCSLLKTTNAIIQITKLGLLSSSGTEHLKRSVEDRTTVDLNCLTVNLS